MNRSSLNNLIHEQEDGDDYTDNDDDDISDIYSSYKINTLCAENISL
jgi:hypothetical protein